MSIKTATFAAIAMAASAAPTLAHHSFAMFDANKTITMEGTVKEFEWTNPHAWMHIVATEKGQPVDWSFEMGSPGQLGSRFGMKPDSVKPGDKVTIRAHPMKDGTNGGQYLSMTLADGHTFGTPAAAGAAPAAGATP
jgi:hypothetical protein